MKKLTHKDFIDKLLINNINYKNDDFKIIGEYLNNRIHIEIEDRYGVCKVNPGNLLKGAVPSISTSIDKNSYFINQAKEIHGDKYDYKKVKYDKNNKVTITCKEHGDFEQTPKAHLQGQGCKECKRYSRLDGRRLTTKSFIEKAKKVHNNLYIYKKSKVTVSKENVIITCPIHGDFEQTPNSHLKGRGCSKCYIENSGYSKSNFTYFAKNRMCKLYLIELYNKKEKFIKIGITSKTLKERFYGDHKLPYNYKVIKIIESRDCGLIWDEESKIKKFFREYKHNPKINFQGYTECFEIGSKKEIINYLKLLENGI